MQSGTTHVLLVEDEAAHAELIQLSFEALPSLRLTVATTLQQARERAEQAPPDIVIIDSLLPDGRGVELATTLSPARRYPIILLTSQADEAMKAEALAAGVTRYVVKSDRTLLEMPDIVLETLRSWSSALPHS
ncbi:MAG: response regulator [Acidobacteriota bacterium]